MVERLGMAVRMHAFPASRATRRLLWAVLLALPMLWHLGGTPLFDVDEGAFSEATREMLASHDWGHTTLNGADRFDKPIGIYWLQATAVSVFGLSEFALRLPSALAGWIMGLALGGFAARRWGQGAGMLAGAVAVTSLGPQLIGRGATADGLLNLLIVLSALDLWRFIESGGKAPLRRAYTWVGLGLLVKGPVAVLVPGAAFLLWCATSRRWSVLRAAASDLVGWVLVLAIAVPWYAYALHRHGTAFIDGFLLHHNVQRFTGTVGGHAGSPLYYLVVLPVLAMPWAPLLVAVAARVRPLWRDPLMRYLLAWAGFVLVFFSLSSTKLPHYVLYGYAPLVLLMTRVLHEGSQRWRNVTSCGIVAWSVLAAALPSLVLHFAPTVRDDFFRPLLAGAPAPLLLPALCAVAIVAALAFWPGFVQAPWRRPVAAALAVSLLIAGWSMPWFGEALQGPVGRAAAVAVARGGPAVQWQVHLPSFSVYVRRSVPQRAPGPQEMALTRSDRLPPGDDGRPRLFDERGVVLLGPKPAP
jgi:4-amino-4-deoxy-L-arabinose transferase-like glycosyltransferase